MYEHNALGYWSGLTLCLTKVRSSRARCLATALIGFPTRRLISKAYITRTSVNKGDQKIDNFNNLQNDKMFKIKKWLWS